jgi:hypothetical protein
MADLTITAASVLLTSGSALSGTAGATITAGQCVYLDSVTNTLKLAQADGTAAEAAAVGIALHASLSGQPLAYAPTGSTINIGATTVKTTAYMVAPTAGGVAPQADLTSGHRIVYLGYATTTGGVFKVAINDTGTTV